MKVLIVDDHAIVRAGLKQIIAEAGVVDEVGEAANGADAVMLVGARQWDIVLLDIGLPERNGIEALKQIKAVSPKTRVLMLSMHPEEQYAVRALKAGAAGYLTKESAPDELLTAMHKLLNGGRYVSAAVTEILVSELSGDVVGAPHEQLSDREFDVLRLIGLGKTVSEIAETLCLSVKTVSTYRRRILEKMGMKTNAELTHYAVKQGLV